jgi:hypothetical protein
MTIIQTSTPGPQGAPGESGNTVWPTTGAPSVSLGENGDFANDTANSVMYGPKAAGAWPSGVSYKGATGTSGTNGSAGPQGVPGANAKWQTGQSYTGLVATRAKVPTNGGFSQNTAHMARTIHVARTNITQIGAAFANWYCNGTAEVAAGASCTITASVEYPLGGAITRLTFGGNNSGTAFDFSTLASDLVTLAIPSGAQFAIREFRQCATNGSVCFTGFTGDSSIGPDVTAGDCFVYTGATDLTGATGSFTSTDSSSYAPPIAVFGPTTVPSYALFGDSRVEGYQDTPNGNLYVGELARSVGPVRAFTNLAKFGETLAAVVGTGFTQRAAIAAKYCTHIICNYGVNDLFTGALAPTVLKNLTALRQQFPAQYFYQTTIDPETTSTDSWATTTNQTLVSTADETQRQRVNNTLRSKIVCFDGVFDTSSVVETGINTGIWKAPGYTIDGVHGTANSYGLIASSGVVAVV